MAKVEGMNVRGLRHYVRTIVTDDLKAAYGKSCVNLFEVIKFFRTVQ